MNNTNKYCFLDLDLDDSRRKLATCAAFVDSTDLTYGFSSKNLLALGGSELSRLKELISTDHEWSSKDADCGGVVIQPPPEGNSASRFSSIPIFLFRFGLHHGQNQTKQSNSS